MTDINEFNIGDTITARYPEHGVASLRTVTGEVVDTGVSKAGVPFLTVLDANRGGLHRRMSANKIASIKGA